MEQVRKNMADSRGADNPSGSSLVPLHSERKDRERRAKKCMLATCAIGKEIPGQGYSLVGTGSLVRDFFIKNDKKVHLITSDKVISSEILSGYFLWFKKSNGRDKKQETLLSIGSEVIFKSPGLAVVPVDPQKIGRIRKHTSGLLHYRPFTLYDKEDEDARISGSYVHAVVEYKESFAIKPYPVEQISTEIESINLSLKSLGAPIVITSDGEARVMGAITLSDMQISRVLFSQIERYRACSDKKKENGQQGNQGNEEENGAQGNQSNEEENGPQGNQSNEEENGQQGNQGNEEENGQQGNQDNEEENGPQGNQSNEEENGQQGNQDHEEENGQQGNRGNKEENGQQGNQGNEEENGQQGNQGNEEENGQQGNQGNKEENGQQGNQGNEEENGQQGNQGNEEENRQQGNQGNEENCQLRNQGKEEENGQQRNQDKEEKSQQGNQGKEKGNCQLRNQGKEEENSHKKYNQWKEKENMIVPHPHQDKTVNQHTSAQVRSGAAGHQGPEKTGVGEQPPGESVEEDGEQPTEEPLEGGREQPPVEGRGEQPSVEPVEGGEEQPPVEPVEGGGEQSPVKPVEPVEGGGGKGIHCASFTVDKGCADASWSLDVNDIPPTHEQVVALGPSKANSPFTVSMSDASSSGEKGIRCVRFTVDKDHADASWSSDVNDLPPIPEQDFGGGTSGFLHMQKEENGTTVFCRTSEGKMIRDLKLQQYENRAETRATFRDTLEQQGGQDIGDQQNSNPQQGILDDDLSQQTAVTENLPPHSYESDSGWSSSGNNTEGVPSASNSADQSEGILDDDLSQQTAVTENLPPHSYEGTLDSGNISQRPVPAHPTVESQALAIKEIIPLTGSIKKRERICIILAQKLRGDYRKLNVIANFEGIAAVPLKAEDSRTLTGYIESSVAKKVKVTLEYKGSNKKSTGFTFFEFKQ